MKALGIIRGEHRALAAVLHGLAYLVRDIRDRGATPDFDVLSAMIYYIDAFPERYHHPKEERYLFPVLRARCPEARATVELLDLEHVAGAKRLRDLEQALVRYREGGKAEFAAFAGAVESYVVFEGEHMRREEREVLPLAERHFTAEDWATIDAAFEGHSDPLLGTQPGEQWDRLFTRIVTLAPAPLGVGPPAAHR